MLVDLDVEVKQYSEMSLSLERELPNFIEELRKLKSSQPQLGGRINTLEAYMVELRKYLKHPKLFEKIV